MRTGSDIIKPVSLIIAALTSFNLTGQSYTPPPTVFSGVYSSGTHNDVAYNAELNTVAASGSANYDVVSRQYVHIPQGNRAGSFSNGSFHAHIDNPAFDVVSYHPNGFVNIPTYDKFELGIKLPANITQRVDDFFGDYMTGGHHGYGCEFKQGSAYPNNINPYDPGQISVEATFHFANKPDQTVNGFYYRDYSYIFSSGTIPSYAGTDWVEDTQLQYHWRVRFAPKYAGAYQITWVIKVNGATVITDNMGHAFTAVTSPGKGFLKIGSNNKFLVTQPTSSSPQESILPIGVVDSYPDPPLTTGPDSLPTTDCLLWGSDVYYPSRYINYRERLKNRIAGQGANFVRMFSNLYSFDIEWEKAGVYDADPHRPIQQGLTTSDSGLVFAFGISSPAYYKGTNRQAIMWELDQVLDMAKEKDLYIQLILESGENGFNVGTGLHDWLNNPYHDLISSPNPNSVEQFFTDANAKKAYKNKLRYLIARYGYSTNIADFEVYNEFHFLHSATGGNIASLDNTFKPWLEEMLDYIKSPAGLNHKDHLFTTSYQLGFTGDNVGHATDLDFFSTHPYNWNDVSFFGAYQDTRYLSNAYQKPCQASEMGLQGGWECGGAKNMFPEYMTPTIHALLWSTAFIGGLTTGLEMWQKGLDIDSANSTHPCGDGVVQHFKPLRSFLGNTNFDGDNYVPGYYINDPVEAFYLINNNGSNAARVMGYTRNRTFWWTNFTTFSSGAPYYSPSLAGEYQNLFATTGCNSSPPVSLPSSQPVTSGSGGIIIPGLTPSSYFVVDWYDTYSTPNQLLGTTPGVSSNNGQLVIFPPPFGGSCTNQEYGFKVRAADAQAREASALETSTGKEINGMKKTVRIFPNPASDLVHVEFDPEAFKDPHVAVYDLSGRLVLQSASVNEINTTGLANGTYLIKISDKTQEKTFKINVLH